MLEVKRSFKIQYPEYDAPVMYAELADGRKTKAWYKFLMDDLTTEFITDEEFASALMTVICSLRNDI